MKFRFTAEHFNPVYGTVIDDVMLQTLVNLSNVLLESGCARLSREAEMKYQGMRYPCFEKYDETLDENGEKIGIAVVIYGRISWRKSIECFLLRWGFLKGDWE